MRIDSGVVALKDKLYVIGGYSYGEKISPLQRSIVYSNANEQYNPALDASSFVNTTQASTQPSYSPTLPSTTPSTTKAPESIQSPTTGTIYGETQIGTEHFPTVPVAAVSGALAVIVVLAGVFVYSKKRKGSQDK